VRYYFHFRSTAAYVRDSEGGEFADLEAAREEARLSARELMSLDHGEPDPGYQGGVFEITDGNSYVLAVTEFAEPRLGGLLHRG
jgi:hypothetical protein